MIIGQRGKVTVTTEDGSGNTWSTWRREINGKLFRFSLVSYPDGKWFAIAVEASNARSLKTIHSD